ncbi:MAG: hypothetical protein Q8L87_18390, partial [Anaerolineales bacterium]|nr:hypothetical protein [Anaerolineales bacterium]
RAREAGLWVEVVTLVIPGFNDSNEELWDAARFLAGLSVDIPWHVTAFHKDYKMTEPDNTVQDAHPCGGDRARGGAAVCVRGQFTRHGRGV